MARSYWLVKTEPGAYSWQNLVEDGGTYWDGVRNYQARNNLKSMKLDDRVLVYHSVGTREVVGVAEVTREHYPDPTTDDDRWCVVDLAAVAPLKNVVSLATVKEQEGLAEIALVRQARLSVMPLGKREFDAIVKLGGGVARSRG